MLTRRKMEDFVYQTPRLWRIRRFVQDSPILPDVWLAYAKAFRATDNTETWPSGADEELSGPPRDRPVDLLLNPHRGSNTMLLYGAIGRRLREGGYVPSDGRPFSSKLAYNESFVVVRLRFWELVRVALPLTEWWKKGVWGWPSA